MTILCIQKWLIYVQKIKTKYFSDNYTYPKSSSKWNRLDNKEKKDQDIMEGLNQVEKYNSQNLPRLSEKSVLSITRIKVLSPSMQSKYKPYKPGIWLYKIIKNKTTVVWFQTCRAVQ